MIDRDFLIFDVISVLSAKTPLSTNSRQKIADKIMKATPEQLEVWYHLCSKEQKQDDKLIQKINAMNEAKLKKISAQMDRTLPNLKIMILKEGISDEDTLMKDLEKIFGD